MVIEHLPNPQQAQKYRIKKIWSGDLSSKFGKAMINCDPDGPMIICLSKVQADKQRLVATGRIFSGSCSKKRDIYLLNENKNERIQNIALFMGQRRIQIESLPVGNILAIEGLKEVKSGDTIIDQNHLEKMVPFENVKYVSTPVVTVSVEPEYLRELEKMKELIENLLIEDPNLKFEIREENGEYLLSGTGPLHLEVTANEINKRGVNVSTSEPRAVFKESCKYPSSVIVIKSEDKNNVLKLQVEHLDPKTIKFFQLHDYEPIRSLNNSREIIKQNTGLSEDDTDHLWKCDEDLNVIIYQGKAPLKQFYKRLIIEIINKIHLNGPLCGESLTELKITIKELSIENINEENAFSELSAMFYKALKEGLQEGELILLEPIYKTYIQLPPSYIRSLHSLISKYSAKINKIDHEDEFQALIEILLPVRNSIKFAEDIRSSTSGKAFWQNEFHSFIEIPSHESDTIINDLRFHKGLSW
jgi:elongation factor 2